MKRISAWVKESQRFLKAEEGSALPFIALGIVMLVGATGSAIDMGRIEIVQARMQNALDAAGLAVGSEVSTVNITTETNKYFYANFPSNYLGTTITAGPTATPNADNSVIALSVAGTVNTTFMKIFGINNANVSATSQITRQSAGMELVLVMDNTGSMGNAVNPANSNTPKITAAISAATTLLNVLYGGSNTTNNLWVGLVPFSQTVNVGTTTNWVAANAYDWGPSPSAWKGCVMARPSPYDVSDDVPATSSFPAYYYATTATIRTPTTVPSPAVVSSGACGNSSANPWKCTVDTSSHHVTTHTLTYDFSSGNGPNYLCPQPIQPMVAEKSTVVSALNSMVAGGSTFINIGMAWGQRMLSPNWRSLWGGEMNTNSLPLNYHTPLMNKVLILMTDGMNEFDAGNYTTYGLLSDNQLGTTTSIYSGNAYNGSAEQVLDTRTLTICTNLKANGVIIYTIGFGTDDTDNMHSSTSVNGTLLKACATDLNHYFLAPTNAELTAVFQQIGDSLANLRISQ